MKVPDNLFDPTGATDISGPLTDWVMSNRPQINKDGALTFPARIGTARTQYRMEEALQTGLLNGVVIDGGGTPGAKGLDGAQFIQKTKDPYATVADRSNPTKDEYGKWNTIYLPTNKVDASFTGGSGGSAHDRCRLHTIEKNRVRSFFNIQKSQRTMFRGAQITGCNDTIWCGTAGYDKHHEAQDAFTFAGCTDVAIVDCTIEKLWGNGVEIVAYPEKDGTATATIGLWINSSTFQNFGRQAASWRYGGNVIIDGDTYIGESARTLMDAEPTSNTIDPRLTDQVQGVYLLGIKIGQHGLGMFAMHGITDVYVGGCVGYDIAPSGAAFVKNCIFENNVSVHKLNGGSQYAFADSTNVAIRNNRGLESLAALVLFHGGDSNYSVHDNPTRGAQFQDNENPVTPKPYVDFTVPVPAHALRDAAH